MDRLMKDGAVHPHNAFAMIDIVFDLGSGAGVMRLGVVRAEMAVRDSVTVVRRIRLMDVLGRHRRRKRQKRRDNEHSGAAVEPDHDRIIEACPPRVNRRRVTNRSVTSH
jgi:hypothetical protein